MCIDYWLHTGEKNEVKKREEEEEQEEEEEEETDFCLPAASERIDMPQLSGLMQKEERGKRDYFKTFSHNWESCRTDNFIHARKWRNKQTKCSKVRKKNVVTLLFFREIAHRQPAQSSTLIFQFMCCASLLFPLKKHPSPAVHTFTRTSQPTERRVLAASGLHLSSSRETTFLCPPPD